MDYKKLIKNEKTRDLILSILKFIPDKPMICLQYRVKTGRWPNLSNPKRYTEKLQWYKLNYRNPLMVECADKYEVRGFIKSLGLESILNDCYGVFNSFDEINFDLLPKQFVIKDTLGGGSRSVFVIKDKDKMNVNSIKKELDYTINRKLYKSGGREWIYYSGKHNRIIIEKYIEQANHDLADYKFFCFDGKVKAFYVRTGYALNHKMDKTAFFNYKKKQLKTVVMDYCNLEKNKIDLPNNIDEMIHMAEKISKRFPHVRVDMYNVDGKVYFGEMTFFNASGYMTFTPDSFDKIIGSYFVLPKELN